MRVLVTGAGGLLGTEVVDVLRARDHEAIPATRADLDVSDPESVARLAAEEFGKPDWVVNCAAYTAVDRAESEEREATEANGLGVGYLAQACAAIGAKLLHVSTDFVFDGEAETPYAEDAPTNPLGAYGRSKLVGEKALEGNPNAVVARTAWLYGPRGACFPRTMLRAHAAGKTLKVVADQVGCPTYTPDLAKALVDMIERDPFPGVYHVVGPEAMSWHRFAEMAIEIGTGETPEIEPLPTEAWPTPAKRPKYSVLGTARLHALGVPPMRPVREALADFARHESWKD